MLSNRSAPPATVTPVLVYPDVRAAVAWLEAAFGFEERVRIGDAHRAQMRVGVDGAVVVGDVGGDRVTPSGGGMTDQGARAGCGFGVRPRLRTGCTGRRGRNDL